ncbi:hypothetical protein OAF54_02210 [bacterium]|nr:hypothetical protein [bacterium]
MSTEITDFLQSAIDDKPVAAVKAFSAGMEDRVQNALSQKYDEVSQTVFNPTDSVETEIEDNTDLETEMEDNDV